MQGGWKFAVKSNFLMACNETLHACMHAYGTLTMSNHVKKHMYLAGWYSISKS